MVAAGGLRSLPGVDPSESDADGQLVNPDWFRGPYIRALARSSNPPPPQAAAAAAQVSSADASLSGSSARESGEEGIDSTLPLHFFWLKNFFFAGIDSIRCSVTVRAYLRDANAA